METHGVLRRMFSKAKLIPTIADLPKRFREGTEPIGKVLTNEQKSGLFRTAASNPDWMVAFCAAVIAASTTCRGVELKHLRWANVNILGHTVTVGRSKTPAGKRIITLNADALYAFARLRQRSEALGVAQPEHFVFPACENNRIDASRPQKTWRTAWRSLTSAAGLKGFRFHDLRHQAITELAEDGAADAVIQAIAGHLNKRMMDHYCHVRSAAKRSATDRLSCGLATMETAVIATAQCNELVVANPSHSSKRTETLDRRSAVDLL